METSAWFWSHFTPSGKEMDWARPAHGTEEQMQTHKNNCKHCELSYSTTTYIDFNSTSDGLYSHLMQTVQCQQQ